MLTDSLLRVIIEKFPEHARRIEYLFSSNKDFRSLCSDYALCLMYLQKFKKEFAEKKLSLKEYADVHTELETELSGFISND